ncbi:response regulator [bacterium]|nr:response regulator [bacterium]
MTDLLDQPARRVYLRRLKLVMGTVIAAWSFFALRNGLQNHPRACRLDAGFALLTAAILVFNLRVRGPRQLRLLTQLNFAVSCLGIFCYAQITGQSLALTQWNLVALPLAVTYQLGERAGGRWGMFSIITVVAIHASAVLYPQVPEFVPRTAEFFSTNLVLILLVTVLGRHFRATADAQLQELAEARDRALAADALKSQFVATISHEIRTPLQGVVGMSQLLAETDLDEQQRAMVETLVTSGKTLRSVVDDILDFSRLESHRMELEQVPFSPEEACYDAVEPFAPQAFGNGVELVVQADSQAALQYLGDPLRFRQIVANLVSNAVKFTATGSVVVDLRGSPTSLHLAVRDTGIGVPADMQSKIFEVFRQLDASTTRQYGGSGLGLAICQRLAGLWDRHVVLTSEVDRGSTFSVELPWPQLGQPPALPLGPPVMVTALGLGPQTQAALQMMLGRLGALWVNQEAEVLLVGYPTQAPDTGQARLVSVRRPGDGTPESGLSLALPLRITALAKLLRPPQDCHSEADCATRTRTSGPPILIVDDTPINQKVLERMARSLGYTPQIAQNGAQALEMLAKGRFFAVLMDLHMPVMDGLQATRLIRQQLSADQQPLIVAVTANNLAEQKRELLESGADAFLGKPVEMTQLGHILDRFQQQAKCAGKGPPDGCPPEIRGEG